jgi:hypothetical protein
MPPVNVTEKLKVVLITLSIGIKLTTLALEGTYWIGIYNKPSLYCHLLD